MTIADQMAAANEAKIFWNAMLPDVEAPEMRTFLIWTTFDNAAVVRGILRAAKKFTKTQGTANPMNPNDAHRYCSAVIRDEAKELAQ